MNYTFQFHTDKVFQEVARQLNDTPYMFSVCYGEIHYGLKRCITVYKKSVADMIKGACEEAGYSYVEVR